MQGKNFLFERSDLNRQTPTMLFKRPEFGRVELSNVSTNLLPQFNLFDKHHFDENSNNSSFYATPPMKKKSIMTPKAPVKNKAQSKKVDLKPKKLQYTEDELDVSSAADSGIYEQSYQSNDTLFCKQLTVKCHNFDSSQKQIPRLHTKLDKIKVQTNDKENDKKIIKGTRNNIAQVSSVVFDPNAEELSQCDKNLDWKGKLYWLQPRRDVGLWIECCRKQCKKWRYTNEYHDPSNVPKVWYCEMNSDKSRASCNMPEDSRSRVIQKDLIENAYNAGSIVWALVRGYPWWPGIVDDCPVTFRYYKLHKNSLKPCQYYVTFINEGKLECAWVSNRNIKPFASIKYSQLIKKTTFYGIDYKNSLDKAYKIALNVLPLSILERLQKLSYVTQYEKLYKDNNNFNESVNKTMTMNAVSELDTNSDDEIPSSIPIENSFTLKDYYFKVLSKKRDTYVLRKHSR